MLVFSFLIVCQAYEKQEMSMEKQMIRGVAGPIAETHVNILHDLEANDPANLDILTWLAKRYAEKCEFDLSQSYYKVSGDGSVVR